MNYSKRFQNVHALSISVGNSYSEDKLMHTFMDNFHQGGKYSAQIASHQAYLSREKKIDQKSLNTSSLETDYLNLYSISGFGRNSQIANTVQTNCTLCGGVLITLQKMFQKDQTEEGKISCGWCLGQQTNATDISDMLQMWI